MKELWFPRAPLLLAAGYDSLGQVTNGVKCGPDGAALAGHAFGYQFDDIGNRESASRDDVGSDYTANLLNQYVGRTVPGRVVAMGEASTDVVIQVNGVGAQRQGKLFYRAFTADNTAMAVYSSVEVKGMTSSQTNQAAGHRFTPKTPEGFEYDLDGNLVQDGRWDYIWDGENRLIGMETRANLPVAIPRQKLAFTYDSQSRRITKTVSTNSGASYFIIQASSFLYDGWNLVSEIRYLPTQQRTRATTYVWGPDLSGTFQGAGGIGGLLASYASTLNVSHLTFYAFDGNGNVMALVDAGTRQAVAQYEYSPFGEVIRASGAQAKANPFQFSTKYCDEETGLDYYGYRYLCPEAGRWVGRDPIEEDGGENLYTFAHNDAVGLSDMLGLWTSGLHDGLTKIAASTYFTTAASGDIGKYDNAVDSEFPPTSPYLVNQQYHFNTTYGTGSDSRNTISAARIQKAKDFCDKRLHNDNYAESVKNFGYSIHPVQDITAHGDYPGWVGLVPHLHNVSGPQLDGAPGSPSDYPDGNRVTGY